ncbi:MAG TPA: aminomethyl-transferring glycine dehydrogenase subunit GcvPA [Firmicutes bacterium]|nr:aminomethyl-transferring glycine dehydrogenase subunit GcvPA [Bacillota bacterium]
MNFIPGTQADRRKMLETIGAGSIEELFGDIPESVRLKRRLRLPEALSELELMREMRWIASKNLDFEQLTPFIGAGVYDHYVPEVVKDVCSKPEFYTAYTPYQAEISQGTLQSIFEFQSLICELTGMDVANASLYDGATAVVEAALMCCRHLNREKVLVSSTVNPQYRMVLRTYASGAGLNVSEVPWDRGLTSLESLEQMLSGEVGCVILQQPNFFGCIEDFSQVTRLVHSRGALVVDVADPISLGVLKSPGEYGVDVACGEAQCLGNPVSFGGPLLGYFAVRAELVRRMPGRIVGETHDAAGRRGYVLTLQAREQHIRREKATSNICSNEALNALAACVYLSVMGKNGIREVGLQCLAKSHYAAEKLNERGIPLAFPGVPFFKEFVVKVNEEPSRIVKRLVGEKLLAGYALGSAYKELGDCLLVAVTEKRTKAEIDHLAEALGRGVS